MDRPATAPSRTGALVRRLVGRLLLGVLALLLVAVATQPWWLAQWVTSPLARNSGRSVHVDSIRIGLSPALEPVVRFSGVQIQNAAWADVRQPFAALAEAIAVISWRSVGEGRPVIALMVLRDGSVDFERQADGLRNWRLRDPENRGPGRIKLMRLMAERATVRFRHAGINLVLAATAKPSSAAGSTAGQADAMPTQIDVEGGWRGVPFTGSIATGAVLSFVDTDSTFPLRGEVQVGGARLALDGWAGDLFRAPRLDARMAFGGDSLAALQPLLGGGQQAGRKPFHVEGQLKVAQQGYVISGARARVGATELFGDVGFTASGSDRHTLRARLRSDAVDVADLLWLVGKPEPANVKGKAKAVAAKPPAAPASASAWRRFDAEVGFEAARLRAAEAPWLHSLSFEASLVDGLLHVARLDAGVLQGRASGHLDVDLRQQPPGAEGEMALHGLHVESLMHEAADKKRITGVLAAQARLKAVGDSARALLASATGSVGISLSGGTISSLLDAEIGLQGGKMLRSLVGGAEAIPIRCAAADLEVRQGSGRLRTLVLDTERTRTTGTGTIDLRGATFDLVLTPEAKESGLFNLERSIRLHGPIAKPARELIARTRIGTTASHSACPR